MMIYPAQNSHFVEDENDQIDDESESIEFYFKIKERWQTVVFMSNNEGLDIASDNQTRSRFFALFGIDADYLKYMDNNLYLSEA